MQDGPLAEPDGGAPPPAVGHATVPDSAKLTPGVPPSDPAEPGAPDSAAAAGVPAASHRGVAPVPGIMVDPPGTVYGGSADYPAPTTVPAPPSGPTSGPPSAPPPASGETSVQAPEPATGPPPDHGDETSGSLTGFILSRGRTDGPRSRTRLIVIGLVILAMIAVLAVVGLFAVQALIDAVLG